MTTFIDWTRPLCCLAALLGGMACGEIAPDTEDAPALARAPAPAPADLAALMHRVHFAYRDDGDALRGGHDSYLASIARGTGRLAFTPLRATPSAAPVQGDVVQVETLGAWRGGAAIAPAAPPAAIDDDGSATLTRGAIRERLRNTGDGVEQTFELDRAPAGAGSLIVRVAITGQPLVAETETGFHFRAPASALGVRYGTATWVDAAGRRIPLAAHARDGAIEIAVPADVLDAAAYPAMIDPLIGPEIAVDVPVVAAPTDQRIPRTAFDGSRFVVVWQDRRAGLDWDIYGARVDAAGRVIDSRNFVVVSAAGPQENPDVACMAGSDCVAVWQSGGDIFAAEIPLGSGDPGAPFVVSSAPNTQATPKVACDDRTGVADRRCLVVYYDLRGGSTSDIFARKIKTGGIDGSPELALSTSPGSEFGPVITFTGSQYVVAWQDGGGGPTTIARATRVLPDGTIRDPGGFAVSSGGADRPCAVASDGSNVLVVYTHGGSSLPMPLFAQLVDATVGAASGAAVRVDTANGYSCSVDFDGTNYLAAWPDGTLVPMARRVSTAGAVVDPAPVPLTGAPSSSIYLDVAFGLGSHFLAWEDTRTIGSTGYEIYGARIAPGLTRATRVDTLISLIAVSAGMFTPDVARNFQNYLVVWADTRAGASDIYGARFNFSGQLLDPMGIPISTAAAVQSHPAVASDNKIFFVVWDDARSPATGTDIYGARVDESGAVLDPAGFPVSTAAGDQRDPDIAFDDPSQRFQVVWSDRRSTTNTDIYGTQIDRGATVLSPAGVIVSAFPPAEQVQPAIANLPGKFLVTWTDTVGSGPPLIWGVVMNNTGGVVIGDFNINPAGSTGSAVASDGSNFLVAWQRNDIQAIEGRVVSPAASLVSGVLTLSPIAAGTLDPALAYDGSNYGLVYSRTQSLYGRRIAPGGAIVDPETVIQVGSGNDLFEPAIAASKPDQFFVAYDRFVAVTPAHMQVFARNASF